ncbi:DMT family transporter [Martelella sp. HB161492]|uniref:DMT family transporter n=1 Tax=Martelella sp. HB161492 TaxID=2720726 RepID=UPI0015912955|nr:DMT family transporter [Martelella sp. HB161492]
MTDETMAVSGRMRFDKKTIAIMLMIGSVAAFTTIDTLTKTLTTRHDPVMLIFLQNVAAALVILPLALRKGASGFRIQSPRLLLLRGVLGALVSFLIYTSLKLLPFTVATSLLQLETFFVIPLAMIFLKERPDWRRFLAVGLGISGALFILQPGGGTFQMAGLIAIAAALALAAKDIVLKFLAMNEQIVPALFWMYVVTAIIMVGPAITHWSSVGLADWGFIIAAAILMNGCNFGMLKAYSMADAVVLAPVIHSALPMAVMVGVVVFGEWPSPLVWVGIVLIAMATFMPSGKRSGG